MLQCHGHKNNMYCLNCQKFEPRSFSWDMTCNENKQMLAYKLNKNLLNNKNESKKNKKRLIDILNSFKESKTLNSKNSFKHGYFYYNFNFGLNFKTQKKSLLVKIFNAESGNKILEVLTTPEKIYSTVQKFYVKWRIEVYDQNKLYFEHELDLTNKDVLIITDSKLLGDNMAYIDSVSTFQKKHNCNLFYYLKVNDFINLFSFNYDNINFINKKGNKRYYATYNLAPGNLFSQYQTIVYDRIISLEKIPEYILGIKNGNRQKLKQTEFNFLNGKYVVYAEKASSKMKQWNNPKALKETIDYLQKLGYKVVNIDKKPINKQIKDVIYLNDKNYSLQDKINILSEADFFIGLPSGLSWLAWKCHIPTIVLGGFSLPICEFDNPYRIISTDYCFGCWNYNQGKCRCFQNNKDNKFICNKSITSKQVIDTINRLLNDINQKKE